MTVREQLEDWGVPIEAVLGLELDPVPPTSTSTSPTVRATSDELELVIRVVPPTQVGPLDQKHAAERARLSQRQRAERRAANAG